MALDELNALRKTKRRRKYAPPLLLLFDALSLFYANFDFRKPMTAAVSAPETPPVAKP
jgi:hypothetical protein